MSGERGVGCEVSIRFAQDKLCARRAGRGGKIIHGRGRQRSRGIPREGRKAGEGRGRWIDNAQFVIEIGEGLLNGGNSRGGDEALGAHHTGEAGGRQAQDADEIGYFGEGGGGLAELDEAAGEDAQGGDLIEEAA